MRLVHFTAEWCQPCKMMKPIIDEILVDRDNIDYVSVDIDEHRQTAIDYEIMSVPTFVLENEDGTSVRVIGAMPKQKFIEALGI